MLTFVSVFLFFVGLIIGSFLNVVIIRGERGEGLGGRSRCIRCGRTLGWTELIPVASFVFQRGRCRRCKRPISLQYPLVELATALAFAAIAWYFLPLLFDEGGAISVIALLGLGLACVSISAGIVILVSDLRFQIIPDGAVLTLLAVGALRLPFQTKSGMAIPDLVWNGIILDIAIALAIALFFASLWFCSRGRWMGFGDVKLVAATSLLVGYPAAIAAVLFSFWIGGIVGAVLLLAGKKGWGSRIPFGPFLLVGAGAAWLWGNVFFAFTGLGLMLY